MPIQCPATLGHEESGQKKRSLNRINESSSRKEIRHRTTLPQSNMQYHRRWAPYRSCSGWERELQARHGHRKKRIKDARFMSVELCRNDKQIVNWEIAILYLKTQLGVFFVLMSWQTLEGKKGGQASRPVSNAKLKALLPLHVHPIELVVFKWSSGIKDPGTSYLQGGLALRCFQRLSFPDVATQRCLFRDNWNTRGQSFPVLSY